MKKLVFIFWVLVSTIILGASSYAAGVIKVKVNGDTINFDVNPQVIEGTTIVPVRAISEALGFLVEWEEATEKVSITKGENKIVLTIGSDTAIVNGQEKKLLKAARVVSNRTLIPLRFVSENIDCTVDWFEKNNIAAINARQGGRAARMVDRLWQSDEYNVSGASPKRVLTPKDVLLKYTVEEDECLDHYGKLIQIYDATINVSLVNQVTRNAIKNVLRVMLPKDYEIVYMYFIVALRGEVYELGGPMGNVYPGINSAYHEGRDINAVSQYGYCGTITVGMEGKHKNIGTQHEKALFITMNGNDRQYFIDMFNISEYTVVNYNQIREGEYMKELLQWYYYQGEMANCYYYLERKDVNAKEDMESALDSYPCYSN